LERAGYTISEVPAIVKTLRYDLIFSALRRVRRAGSPAALCFVSMAIAGCAHPIAIHAPMQPDGWSAQPISINRRFAPDADLDPATGTPVGDEGYNLYILTAAANWDHRDSSSFLVTLARRSWGHSWLILESPEDRLECGQSGDFGGERLRYYEGVMRRLRDGDPNPIGYLWETRSDGRCEIGKPNRLPSFVWRMPITRRRYRLIHDYLTHRNNDRFGIRSDNCTDMVTMAAALAGIDLIHRIRLTLPSQKKLGGLTLRVWTDPQYRVLEYGTPDVLEADLRHLAQFGIGMDATEWYLSLPTR
jgi:hypothetical protein